MVNKVVLSVGLKELKKKVNLKFVYYVFFDG